MNNGRDEGKHRWEARFDQGGGDWIKLTDGGFRFVDEVSY